MSSDGRVKRLSLQAELRANFNDFPVLGAPDTVVKAACRILLTTGILTGTKLVASKPTELDRRTADAASRILPELIRTHDMERQDRARSGCFWRLVSSSSTSIATCRTRRPCLWGSGMHRYPRTLLLWLLRRASSWRRTRSCCSRNRPHSMLVNTQWHFCSSEASR